MKYVYGDTVTKKYNGKTVKWRSFLGVEIEETAASVKVKAVMGMQSRVKVSFSFNNKRISASLTNGKKVTVDNAGKKSFNLYNQMRVIAEKEYVYPKEAAKTNKTISCTLKAVAPAAWKGSSPCSTTVTIPPYNEATMNCVFTRCDENQTPDERGYYCAVDVNFTGATIGRTKYNSIQIKVGDEAAPVTFYHNGEALNFPVVLTETEFTCRAVVDNLPPMQEHTLKVIATDSTGKVAERGHTLKNAFIYVPPPPIPPDPEPDIPEPEVPPEQYTPEPNTPRWKATIVVTPDSMTDFAFPEHDTLGNALVNVSAYKDNRWIKVDPQDGWQVDVISDTEWRMEVLLCEGHVADETALTTTATVKVSFTTTSSSETKQHSAIFNTSRNLNFSTGLANSVFISGCNVPDYASRAWYSKVNNPLYFPDTNYIEVGSNDKAIMGLTKVGEYLGIIKQGATTETSVYLAFPTSFEDETTYAVKQSINGIGAVAKHSFNILNGETLFLSEEGIMAIEIADDENAIKDRSFYLNGKLMKEKVLEEAFSIVFKGLYLLAVNDKVYVLDGSQRSSWGNDKTNLVYECYYLENVPVKNFIKCGDELWFSDHLGNLCKFKELTDHDAFTDAYNAETLEPDVAIDAKWSTILDDDGSAHLFKSMRKRGCLLSLMPSEVTSADVSIKTDRGNEVSMSTPTYEGGVAPHDFYFKKKLKKYKRLKFDIKNSKKGQGFGINKIIKLYTVGNYSK